MKRRWKYYLNKALVATPFVICLALIIGLFAFLVYNSTHPAAEKSMHLSELEAGVYAYEQTVVSSIPAENYTLVTICGSSGRVYTFKCRQVDVVNTTSVARAVWKEYHIINSTELTLYIPSGSLKYTGAVTVRG